MKTAKLLVPLTMATFLAAVSARAMVEPQLSNIRTASCLVKITADPSILPLDSDSVAALLRSSGVGGKAAREVLGVLPDNIHDLIIIESVQFLDEESYDQQGGVGMDDYGMLTEEVTRPTSRRSSVGPTSPSRSRTGTRPRTASQQKPETGGPYGEQLSNGRGRAPDTGEYYTYYYARKPEPTPSRRPTAAPSLILHTEKTVLVHVVVQLGEDMKPAAEEFMNALVRNLDDALMRAFQDRTSRLKEQIEFTQSQRDKAQAQLLKLMEQTAAVSPSPAIKLDPADQAVYEQLNQIVDLSALSPTMPFSEAIDRLRNSVKPPLKIVVLWRDLLESADIEPATAINMDGIAAVRLGTALELLLRAVASGFESLGYTVHDGLITVATVHSLPSRYETRVYEVPSPFPVADELAEVIQETIEPDTWSDAGGQGTIKAYLGKKLAILQTPQIHQKIQEFLQTIKIDIPTDIRMDVSEEALVADKHNLVRDRQRLEMDIARLEARRSAIEQQIVKINDETTSIKGDTVTVELQRLLELQIQHLENVKKLVEVGRTSHTDLADAEERLARARIELAKRREELTKLAGGDQVARYNIELADMMIDLAEKKAELDVVGKQLKETEKQLTMLTAIDPAVTRIRLAVQALEVAEQRLSELKTRLANLQPPVVTVLGAE
jgi:hypothetical protein